MNNSAYTISNMANAADEYCALVDQLSGLNRDRLLAIMQGLLPRVHAAIVALPDPPKNHMPLSDTDLEARFSLYKRIHEKLGEQDNYWLDFDRDDIVPSMSGSLADDFTDIYFDLKRGLRMLDSNPDKPQQAAIEWSSSYSLHWGQHLVDAERQLYSLSITR